MKGVGGVLILAAFVDQDFIPRIVSRLDLLKQRGRGLASVHGDASSRGSVADVEKFAWTLFQALWRLDFLSMALNG